MKLRIKRGDEEYYIYVCTNEEIDWSIKAAGIDKHLAAIGKCLEENKTKMTSCLV
jgi:hypothetical protein